MRNNRVAENTTSGDEMDGVTQEVELLQPTGLIVPQLQPHVQIAGKMNGQPSLNGTIQSSIDHIEDSRQKNLLRNIQQI